MRINSSTLLLGLTLTSLTPLAHAGGHRDGISVAELEARQAERFASADVNGDGLIDGDEFAALEPRRHRGATPRRRRGAPPRGADTFPEDLEQAIFAELDGDGDGALTSDEFSLEAQRSARQRIMRAELFARLDGNDDGYLDPDEFPPRRMLGLDSDGDGQLTREELHGGFRHRRRDG